jgi:hypothetical protein
MMLVRIILSVLGSLKDALKFCRQNDLEPQSWTGLHRKLGRPKRLFRAQNVPEPGWAGTLVAGVAEVGAGDPDGH